jgi:hypothetical protein
MQSCGWKVGYDIKAICRNGGFGFWLILVKIGSKFSVSIDELFDIFGERVRMNLKG